MYYTNRSYPFYRSDASESNNNNYIVDSKQGDVNGDGYIDNVYLVVNKNSPGEYGSSTTQIMVQDGATKKYSTIPLGIGGEDGAELFLGYFSSKRQMDMLVSIESGGSGRYISAYLVTIINGQPVFLLNHTGFEEESVFDRYTAEFKDDFKVEVVNVDKKDMMFIIDVSARKQEYIEAGIYTPKGKLLKPMSGGVLDIGGAFPVVKRYNDLYQLLTIQRIIGINNSDNLGAVETYFKWNGKTLEADWVDISIGPSI